MKFDKKKIRKKEKQNINSLYIEHMIVVLMSLLLPIRQIWKELNRRKSDNTSFFARLSDKGPSSVLS